MSFNKITKAEVFVSRQLAMMCRGLSPPEIEAMQKGLNSANAGIYIYMNDSAADAFGRNAAPFPVGAVVVKQKTIQGYTDKSRKLFHTGDNGVGGMVKRSPGYDPAHGDWEYFYFDNPAKIESGRIASCVQCHDSAKAKDYVFGTWRNTSE